MNRKLEPKLETVFLMPAETYTYLSSRLVKEIVQHGGSVADLVPPVVEQRLRRKFVPHNLATQKSGRT
jgi:pantetheine-phosphate adenylyltransferase